MNISGKTMKKRISFLALMMVVFVVTQAQTNYTLEQLTDSALLHNNAVKTARNDIEIAGQQRKEAFTNYFPNVSAVGLWFNADKGMAGMELNPSEYIPQSLGMALAQMMPPEELAALSGPVNIDMMKNGTIAGVTAVQPVFMGGQIVNGNKLAKVGEDVSKLKLRLSENEVRKTTWQYYWQLVTLQEKMNTVEAARTFLAGINKDVDVAVKAGVAMRNDLLQVQLRQNEVESQKLQLQNGISLMRLLLAQFCGLRDTSFVLKYASIKDTDVKQLGTPLMPSNQNAYLTRLPEYQLLQQQVKATDLQRKMEIGKNMPSVAVGAGYNYHNLLDKGRSFGMIFATVSVPISGWWGGSHAIKRKKIEQKKAEDQMADNAELLHIRMQKAHNDLVEAQQQLELAYKSIEQAKENLRINRDQYQAGVSKMSDLLEAQMLYQKACDDYTEKYGDYQIKVMEYKISIGE